MVRRFGLSALSTPAETPIRAKATAVSLQCPSRRTSRHLRLRSRSPGPRARRPAIVERPHRQSALEMGNNLLVYTSAPATREIEIFGQPRIVSYAATSAPHADFTAKLVRVSPAGRAEFISIGIARSTWLFRDSTLHGRRNTHGNSRSSQQHSSSRPASACVSKSQAPLSRSTIATHQPTFRRSWPTIGTGRAPRSRSCTPPHIPPQSIFPLQGEPAW